MRQRDLAAAPVNGGSILLIRDLGLMAAAVYEAAGADLVPGASRIDRQEAAGSRWDAFQAAAYTMSGKLVVVFRGTSSLGDGITDVALGLGMNSAYYEQGEAFVAKQGAGDIVLCGHSLGGAIAQVVGNRMGLPIVTFNAPGVAVVASRNIASATSVGTAVRVGGMLASAVVRPGQAWKDVKATFREVRGLNICLMADAVSRIGVHYGKVERIPGTSMNPKTEHGIATVNAVLKKHPLGSRRVDF